MYWTPERIAEFEVTCDRHILRRDNPMPATPTVDQAVTIVRHALIAHTAPDGDLICTADHAAAHAVQALRGAWLMFLDGPDVNLHAPDESAPSRPRW